MIEKQKDQKRIIVSQNKAFNKPLKKCSYVFLIW